MGHGRPPAELVAPTVRLRPSWLRSRDEWGRGVHQDGTGLRPEDDVDSIKGFSLWVEGLLRQGDAAVAPAPGRVHATYWWMVEGDEYVGAITLRHELTDALREEGGHIGYSVRPSARRRGLASWAVRSVLPRARAVGLGRVLLTCADDNVASARTIEVSGGVLEDVRETSLGPTRRYWIDCRRAT